MGNKCPPFYGKSDFWSKKRDKAVEKILKYEAKIKHLRQVIKECDSEISKAENA